MNAIESLLSPNTSTADTSLNFNTLARDAEFYAAVSTIESAFFAELSTAELQSLILLKLIKSLRSAGLTTTVEQIKKIFGSTVDLATNPEYQIIKIDSQQFVLLSGEESILSELLSDEEFSTRLEELYTAGSYSADEQKFLEGYFLTLMAEKKTFNITELILLCTSLFISDSMTIHRSIAFLVMLKTSIQKKKSLVNPHLRDCKPDTVLSFYVNQANQLNLNSLAPSLEIFSQEQLDQLMSKFKGKVAGRMTKSARSLQQKLVVLERGSIPGANTPKGTEDRPVMLPKKDKVKDMSLAADCERRLPLVACALAKEVSTADNEQYAHLAQALIQTMVAHEYDPVVVTEWQREYQSMSGEQQLEIISTVEDTQPLVADFLLQLLSE